MLLLLLVACETRSQLSPLELESIRDELLPEFQGEVKLWRRVVPTRPPTVTSVPTTTIPSVVTEPVVVYTYDETNKVWKLSRSTNISSSSSPKTSVPKNLTVPVVTESSVPPMVRTPCSSVPVTTTPPPCLIIRPPAGSIEDVVFQQTNKSAPVPGPPETKNSSDLLWDWKNWTTQGE